MAARRSARALSSSRAHNPVWSPPAAGTLRRRGGKPRRRANPMQIGVAGIGKRVGATAHRLIEVGHKVTVWNRSADKLQPVIAAGAAAAATPAELARNAEAVITILTDAAAIDAVYAGASGLLAPHVRGKLFIEMSTVQPQTEIALAAKVRAKGAVLVEC